MEEGDGKIQFEFTVNKYTKSLPEQWNLDVVGVWVFLEYNGISAAKIRVDLNRHWMYIEYPLNFQSKMLLHQLDFRSFFKHLTIIIIQFFI